MIVKSHQYAIKTAWTGNQGSGTSAYAAYNRNHEISASDKLSIILGSSDPAFRGDKMRYNPEELFVSSLSACHMLWYLHLCASNGIVVVEYTDEATGIMTETADGSGQFTEVALHPKVIITDQNLLELAHALHQKAHGMCFIARSCNFLVRHEPTIKAV